MSPPENIQQIGLYGETDERITGKNINYLVNSDYIEFYNTYVIWTVSPNYPVKDWDILYIFGDDPIYLNDFVWDVSYYPMTHKVEKLYIENAVNFSMTVTDAASQFSPAVTELGFFSLPNFHWDITPTNNIPKTVLWLHFSDVDVTWDINEVGLPADNYFFEMASCPGISWRINRDNPIPVTYYMRVDYCENIVIEEDFEFLFPNIQYIIMANNLTTYQVDAILKAAYAKLPLRTINGTIIRLTGGGNSGPTGPYAAECPPTVGGEYAYELRFDTCGVSPYNWGTVSIATPV